jgi:hypothetical protein
MPVYDVSHRCIIGCRLRSTYEERGASSNNAQPPDYLMKRSVLPPTESSNIRDIPIITYKPFTPESCHGAPSSPSSFIVQTGLSDSASPSLISRLMPWMAGSYPVAHTMTSASRLLPSLNSRPDLVKCEISESDLILMDPSMIRPQVPVSK